MITRKQRDAYRFALEDSMYEPFLVRHIFPIRDNPGNESWFTAAPRSKPATTKGDTINERGELA